MTLSNSHLIGTPSDKDAADSARISELLELCLIAQKVAEATAVCVVFTPSPARALVPLFRNVGIEASVSEDSHGYTEGRGLFRLNVRETHVSDTVSVGVPVLNGEEVVCILELVSARHDVMATRHASALMSVATLFAEAVKRALDGAAAGPMQILRLIEAVTEHDDAAASRVMTGLLRVAAGLSPTMVEITALRIAGLADLNGSTLSLTHEGRQTLAHAGITDLARGGQVTANPITSDTTRRAMPPARPKPTFATFARLTINEHDYEIGEAGEDEPLAFRAPGSDADWTELSYNLADGWAEIAAEVLSSTADVLREYVRMHMIRRRDVDTDEIAEFYDLHGLSWSIRPGEAGYEARTENGAWEKIALHNENDTLDGMARTRDRAISALMQLWPDLPNRIGPDVKSWARRMALGAKVQPVMGSVAA